MRTTAVVAGAAILLVLGIVALDTRAATQAVGRGAITIDVRSPGARISPTLYGVFFEEISHAGDGGLYAELVQNRGFEDANLPPACVRDGNFIVPPRTPHFDTGKPNDWRLRWDVTSPHPAWSLNTAGSTATIAVGTGEPLNDATPHSLQVDVTDVPAGQPGPTLLNDGYWGMGLTSGATYRLSFFARTERQTSVVTGLQSADGRDLGRKTLVITPGGWKKYETTLVASATEAKARLGLTFPQTSRVWLDMVSLFPAKTFKDRPNGLRPDLAQMVADLKPGFIRGPGGCFAEGITIESRPQWKRSIGPIETRGGTYSPWGYWSTNGFGYHEFLQFAEDIGADALWVVNAGVSCSFRSGTFLPDEDLPMLIQDALDAIEYAIGPATSKWGAERAKHGHPRPFPLKYVEVGNEQRGPRYGERVAKFHAAIREKYPQIKVALSSWIAGIDQRAIDTAGPINIVDEHAYKPVNWAIENFDSFASYPRTPWELYIGEFATNAGVGRGNWIAALNDAVYMMSVEKNSDLVKMASYAPLFENVNKRDWEVNMIHFDSSRAFTRATYDVNRLFAEHLPQVNLKTGVEYTPASAKPIAGRVGVGTWNTAAEYKDLRIERDGKVVYQSDFSGGAAPGWAPDTGRGQGGRGTWTVADGAWRQSGNVVAFSWLNDSRAEDATISVKARKISGAEGFLVFAGTADGRRVQWNVAGWNNTQSAMQAGDAIVGRPARGTIETGRWYDLKVDVRGRTVRGYLDGVLVNEATFPRIDTVLAIAGRDERAGDVVIKMVNTAPEPAEVTFTLAGAGTIASTGRLIVMAADPTAENSFDQPRLIAPVTSTVTGLGKAFTRTVPPYSLSILRVAAK
jgi:alpha-L-arabinofuranosidase